MAELIQALWLCLFAYFGGKNRPAMQKWIYSIMPPHDRYVEVCCGSAGLLLNRKSPATMECLNDKDIYLYNCWKVLQDPAMFPEMMYHLRYMNPSPTRFQLCKEQLIEEFGVNPVLDAARFWFIRTIIIMGQIGPNFRGTYGRNSDGSCKIKFFSRRSQLPLIHKRIQGVRITNLDMLDAIKEFDSAGSLLYIDPPFLPSSRDTKQAYMWETTELDHVRLLESLQNVKCHVILSGHPSELYDEFLTGWSRLSMPIFSMSPTRKIGDIREECVWLNYTPPIVGGAK